MGGIEGALRPQEAGVNPSAEPPETTTGQDRRSFARHEVDSAAVVFLLDLRARVPGRIVDVSLGGCRIRSKDRFPVGIYRRVEVEFTLDGLPFRLAGVVQALHDPYTIGIRLLDLSERKRAQLTGLMEELQEAEQRASGGKQEPGMDAC
ncbi:PilZ domain-containing protein [Acidobacteria bacterium AB60]|nr:PilZ domain-containing protein [Acidobacteria bacterium AB60]